MRLDQLKIENIYARRQYFGVKADLKSARMQHLNLAFSKIFE